MAGVWQRQRVADPHPLPHGRAPVQVQRVRVSVHDEREPEGALPAPRRQVPSHQNEPAPGAGAPGPLPPASPRGRANLASRPLAQYPWGPRAAASKPTTACAHAPAQPEHAPPPPHAPVPQHNRRPTPSTSSPAQQQPARQEQEPGAPVPAVQVRHDGGWEQQEPEFGQARCQGSPAPAPSGSRSPVITVEPPILIREQANQ